jgi:hypothetical protein
MKIFFSLLIGCLLFSTGWASEPDLKKVVMDGEGNLINLRHFQHQDTDRSVFNVSKRDASGGSQWQVSLEIYGDAEVQSLHSLGHQYTVVAGNFRGSLFTQTWHLLSSGKQDSFVVIIDNEGQAVWMCQFGGIQDSQIRGSQLLSNGGFVVFGTFKGMLFAENLPVYAGDETAWFYAMFDASGQLQALESIRAQREDSEALNSPLSSSDLDALHRVLKPKAEPPPAMYVQENPVNDDLPNPLDPNDTGGPDEGNGGG